MRITTILCLFFIVALAACGGGQKTTYSTGNGSATITKNGDTTTYENKEGKVTVGAGAVDLSKLGAPVYPGATQSAENGSISATTAKGSSAMASFSTGDSFDKVYAWYQGHMPKGSEKMHTNFGGASLAGFTTAENTTNQTTVLISAKDNKTQIVISHGK